MAGNQYLTLGRPEHAGDAPQGRLEFPGHGRVAGLKSGGGRETDNDAVPLVDEDDPGQGKFLLYGPPELPQEVPLGLFPPFERDHPDRRIGRDHGLLIRFPLPRAGLAGFRHRLGGRAHHLGAGSEGIAHRAGVPSEAVAVDFGKRKQKDEQGEQQRHQIGERHHPPGGAFELPSFERPHNLSESLLFICGRKPGLSVARRP